MASSLTRDFTGTPTNAKKFTVSFWMKRAKTTSTMVAMCNHGNNGSDDFQFQLRPDDTFEILDYKSGGVVTNVITTFCSGPELPRFVIGQKARTVGAFLFIR